MRLGIRRHVCGRLPRSPWLERSIAALGLMLLADSFLPWYRLSWTVSRYGSGQQTRHVNTATAWHSSSGWSLAVLLGVIAAVGYVTCGAYTNGHVHGGGVRGDHRGDPVLMLCGDCGVVGDRSVSCRLVVDACAGGLWRGFPGPCSGGASVHSSVCSARTAPTRRMIAVAVGEDPDDVGAAADLLVQPFLRVVATRSAARSRGGSGEGQQVVAGVRRGASAASGNLASSASTTRAYWARTGVGVGLVEDGADQGGDPRLRRSWAPWSSRLRR